MKKHRNIAYAANGKLGLEGLKLLLSADFRIPAFLLPDDDRSSCVVEMRDLLRDSSTVVIVGEEFKAPHSVSTLKDLNLDYILSVHFPYILPPEILEAPKVGALNLHPALLPYNKGWHTPTWAILDGTPIGATLHWMGERVDAGDIALRMQIEITPEDTAHSLYQRVLQAELELLSQAIPHIGEGSLPREPQTGTGSFHRKVDLQRIREFNLDSEMLVSELLNLLRALTTDRWSESAFFKVEDKLYQVRVDIREMNQ